MTDIFNSDIDDNRGDSGSSRGTVSFDDLCALLDKKTQEARASRSKNALLNAKFKIGTEKVKIESTKIIAEADESEGEVKLFNDLALAAEKAQSEPQKAEEKPSEVIQPEHDTRGDFFFDEADANVIREYSKTPKYDNSTSWGGSVLLRRVGELRCAEALNNPVEYIDDTDDAEDDYDGDTIFETHEATLESILPGARPSNNTRNKTQKNANDIAPLNEEIHEIKPAEVVIAKEETPAEKVIDTAPLRPVHTIKRPATPTIIEEEPVDQDYTITPEEEFGEIENIEEVDEDTITAQKTPKEELDEMVSRLSKAGPAPDIFDEEESIDDMLDDEELTGEEIDRLSLAKAAETAYELPKEQAKPKNTVTIPRPNRPVAQAPQRPVARPVSTVATQKPAAPKAPVLATEPASVVKEKPAPRKYTYPSLSLIKPVNVSDTQTAAQKAEFEAESKEKSEKLVETLKNFGIGVKVTGVTRGPAVTRFEMQPEIGVKVSRITSLQDDLALSLAAVSIRMEAPIPGKPAIGVEIPNEKVESVFLHDVLSSPDFKFANAKSKLSVALGKSIEGKTVIADLAKMPHMLIAGSTGSGKSVCINTMITSIIYGATPEEVRFIMIDPKVVELSVYNKIPHLLQPVVSEPKKASAALAWAVQEVERRYHLFAEYNVRDIFSFNMGISTKLEMTRLEKMSQIVIIIDELADLMMVASQDVEKSIIRLAQKARAAGVHLVIATQRPSVDVITGIIKANIPSRIAFAVASQVDSRTILDTIGAEKLLGKGDMLYHPIGASKSTRVQGAFVSDGEVEKITEFVRNSYGEPEYDASVAEFIEKNANEGVVKADGGESGGESSGSEDYSCADDGLIRDAVELGSQLGQLSISLLQRKLKLGYSRAARIIDSLEDMGFLSSADGSKPRQVLMSVEEFHAKFSKE